MIRNWLLYVLIGASLFGFMIMYGKQSGFLLLLLGVLWPLVYALITYQYSKKVTVEWDSEDRPFLEKKKPVTWGLQFSQMSSMMEGNRVRFRYVIRTGQGKICEKKKICLPLQRQKEIELSFVPEHAGLYEICIQKVRMYSTFSLLFHGIREEMQDTFFVMPEYRDDILCPELVPIQKEGESDHFLPRKEGNDPTEIWGFREYHPGDKQNRIHWKTSVKTGQFMVPQFGFPVACDIGIFIDLEKNGEETLEQILEIVYVLCLKMIEQDRSCYIIWENRKEGLLERRMLTDEEQVYEILYGIAETLAESTTHVEQMYVQQFENAGFSQVFFLCQRSGQGMPEEAAEVLHAGKVEWMEL